MSKKKNKTVEPLVTVSIPTYNSDRTIVHCLRRVLEQNYGNVEINIVDSESTDNTVFLAKKVGVENIKVIKGSLLQARYEGVKMAGGKYVLILDSDQMLSKNAIGRAVKLAMAKDYSMIAFEESVYKRESLLEKLFDLDRKLINGVNDLSPFTGVIMPRFFERGLLLAAYKAIPKKYFPNTGGPDHAIVYYEAMRIDNRVGILPKAVRHIEPNSIRRFIPKFFRWGYTSVDAHFGKYNKLMRQKERFRTGMFTKGLIVESIGSVALLLLKGVAFKTGYYLAMVDRRFGFKRRY